MLRIPCTCKVIRNIALDILTAHDFTPDHCAQIKKWWLFLCARHSSNEEVDLSFFLYIGVGHVISFREININEFSS